MDIVGEPARQSRGGSHAQKVSPLHDLALIACGVYAKSRLELGVRPKANEGDISVKISKRMAKSVTVGVFAAATYLTLAGCDNTAAKKEAADAAAEAVTEAATPASEITISPPFEKESGYAWIVTTTVDPATRKLQVFENGKPLGPGESLHDNIRKEGKGAYSHWSAGPQRFVIYFSTSDNTDPNINGRTYTLR